MILSEVPTYLRKKMKDDTNERIERLERTVALLAETITNMNRGSSGKKTGTCRFCGDEVKSGGDLHPECAAAMRAMGLDKFSPKN